MTPPKQGYLRSLRLDAGLTQAALAELIQSSATTLSAYETGARAVPPAMVAAIEEVCFARSEPPAPDWDAELAQAQREGQGGMPQEDDPPLPPTEAPMTYTLADLEALARAYWERVAPEDVGGHPCLRDDVEYTLSAFLVFLDQQEAETRAAETFVTACYALTATGDVGAYTAAVLTAQQAGLTPERMTSLMREVFRAFDTGAGRLLHAGHAPWLREEGAAHASR